MIIKEIRDTRDFFEKNCVSRKVTRNHIVRYNCRMNLSACVEQFEKESKEKWIVYWFMEKRDDPWKVQRYTRHTCIESFDRGCSLLLLNYILSSSRKQLRLLWLFIKIDRAPMTEDTVSANRYEMATRKTRLRQTSRLAIDEFPCKRPSGISRQFLAIE